MTQRILLRHIRQANLASVLDVILTGGNYYCFSVEAVMQIRPADASDIDVIVAFNCGIARETEQIELLPDVIRAGAQALFENPADGFYVLVEIEAAVVGSLMITTEW